MRKAILTVLSLLFLMPIGVLILLSVAESWRFPMLLPQAITFDYWKDFFRSSGNMNHSIGLSLLLAVTVAGAVTMAGFFTSKLVQKQENKRFLLQLAYFPYSFSPVIYAFCVQFLFLRLGLSGTFAGVWIAQFLLAFPFAVLLFSSHWTPVLFDMEQMVATLGGNRWQAFREVLFPMSKSILMLAFFQTFLISWFDYGLVSVIGVGKIQTLTVRTYQFVGESNVYFAAIASLLIIWPPLMLWWVNRKFIFV